MTDLMEIGEAVREIIRDGGESDNALFDCVDWEICRVDAHTVISEGKAAVWVYISNCTYYSHAFVLYILGRLKSQGIENAAIKLER